MTDFQRVCEFNKDFDFPIFNADDCSQEAADCYKLRIYLINEEISELLAAVTSNDIIEEMDACGDILYVAYGMAYSYGCNFDEALINSFDTVANYGQSLFKRLIYQSRRKTEMLATICKLRDELNASTIVDTSLTIAQHIIFCIYEYQFNMSYNSDYIFNIVHLSNMSKLCDDEETAAKTVEMYRSKYADRFTSPYYYKLASGKYVVKDRDTQKALKSIKYTKVALDLSLARLV